MQCLAAICFLNAAFVNTMKKEKCVIERQEIQLF